MSEINFLLKFFADILAGEPSVCPYAKNSYEKNMHFVHVDLIDVAKKNNDHFDMYLITAVLAFLLGGQVERALETMNPEKMQKIEEQKNEQPK